MATHYFAYGSNMLTERLTAKSRCPGARPVGLAFAPDFGLAFSKQSDDGSGKATLVTAPGRELAGVLFLIDDSELPALDRAEGLGVGYRLGENFTARMPGGEPVVARTYQAIKEVPGLVPYDWYLALVLAGAMQHRLPRAHLEWLAATPFQTDLDQRRGSRRVALMALEQAGFPDPVNVMDRARRR